MYQRNSRIISIKRNNFIFGGLILVLGGFVGLGFPFIYGIFISDDVMVEPSPAIQVQLPTFEDLFIGSNEDISSTPVPTSSSAPTAIKDHLVIADVNINMPVFLGDTEKVLNKGGWLFPTTSRPDKGGNSVIFGHRYMYRPPKSNTFWDLDKVNVGDEMILYWKGKTYTYKVFETKIIEPTNLSVIQPSKDSILTVITCTPLFSTKQRLVVTGVLVSVK